MKICYIWVKHFRNFDNFGFNLSSSHKFEYDLETNSISIQRGTRLPDDFFGARITDVIGIIGKNGAGKSNALELICKLSKGAKTSVQTDFLIIIEDKEVLRCYFSFEGNTKPSANFDIQFEDYKGSINPLKVVFFSNVFDERRNEFDGEVSDISANTLFMRPFLKGEKITAFAKQVRLINSKVFSTLNIEFPVQVQFTNKIFGRVNTSMDRYAFGSNFDALKHLGQLFRSRLREIKRGSKFTHLMRLGFFFEVLYNFARKNRDKNDQLINHHKNLELFISSLANLKTEEISEGLIDFLETEFSTLPAEQLSLLMEIEEVKDSSGDGDKLPEQIAFLRKLKHSSSELLIEHNSEGIRNRGREYFTFDYKSEYAKSFVNEYISLFGQLDIFEINWVGISSGHKAYLNLFASLFQELRYTRQEHLLLCIDEGDLYLHPMWQIEFFDKLIKVLPRIFTGNIQLVLTSHSPFLLSDLPKQNITILDKSLTGSSQNGTELKMNTFGANLYDLYSGPFFLGQKRTSDFAYSKIKDLINAVENKRISKKDRVGYMALANLIGDEVIQYRIKKLLKNDQDSRTP